MSKKKTEETFEKQVLEYDEEDEYFLMPNGGPCTLITLLYLKDNNFDE